MTNSIKAFTVQVSVQDNLVHYNDKALVHSKDTSPNGVARIVFTIRRAALLQSSVKLKSIKALGNFIIACG